MSNDIKLESIQSAYEYIDNLNAGINAFYRYLQEGDEQLSLDVFGKLVEGFSWLLSVINLNNDILAVGSEISRFNDTLRQIESSLLAKDYNYIGDLLLYEIKPLLDILKEKLNEYLSSKL